MKEVREIGILNLKFNIDGSLGVWGKSKLWYLTECGNIEWCTKAFSGSRVPGAVVRGRRIVRVLTYSEVHALLIIKNRIIRSINYQRRKAEREAEKAVLRKMIREYAEFSEIPAGRIFELLNL